MNAVEVSEKVVKENAVEKKVEKTVNAQTVNKNKETITKMIMQKIEALDIDLSEISELIELVRNISDLNMKIQKLSEERSLKLNRAREIYGKIDGEAKTLLEFIGFNVTDIERVIGVKTQTTPEKGKAERGNGLSGKKIVFNGKMYNMATYFMKKMGISGGLRGLEEWAKQRGYSLKVEDDVIYIL